MKTENTYLIQFDRNDIHNNITFECTKEELNDALIEEELMDEGDDYSKFDWVIFENGLMIQG
jgi:hypothetical protein